MSHKIHLFAGPTQRRHILVETIEDIGKEADKWDEDEPLSADDEFTVSYGLSVDDRKRMLTVIRSAPKRQLASAAKVSTRTIPRTQTAVSLPFKRTILTNMRQD